MCYYTTEEKMTLASAAQSDQQNGRVLVIPQSCRDLALLGHTLDGFYQVQSVSHPKKVATVLCDFSNDGTQGKLHVFTLSNIISFISSYLFF